MKVLLVQPPIEDFYDTSVRTYPLGLLYLAARLGPVADVALLDARTGFRPEPLKEDPFPDLAPFYRERVSTPFSFFTRYRRFGLAFEKIKAAVAAQKPDIVAISSMCSAYERQALEVAGAAKAVSREIRTVVGGVHPTLFPERLLSCDDVDYCVRGEGETPFFRLVSALSRGPKDGDLRIAGLCFRLKDGLCVSDPQVETDIDTIPMRQLLDARRYRIGKKKYTFFLTSRGCPKACAFCGKPPGPYRKRSIAAIEAEMGACAGLGYEAIDFEDDMLNLDTSFFSSVLRLFVGGPFTLSAMNGIYPANLDLPTLELMHRAGFRRLNFSLVDLSESVLERQARHLPRSFGRLLPWLESAPFLVEVHFIIGLPGQRPDDVIETLLFLMGRRLLLGPSIFYLSPGSPMSASVEGGVPLESMRSSCMLPLNPLFPRIVTHTFVKLVRFINYVKGLLDADAGITRASDLLDARAVAADERRQTIFGRLLREKRFVHYDLEHGVFSDDAVEPALIRAFFEKARGGKIKGYRTGNELVMDV